jgi:RND family efflux transporter MFP subunit
MLKSINPRTARAAALLAFTAALAACKGPDASKAATGPSAMLVGPENVAVVQSEEIRSGPAISGTLTPLEQATVRAEVGGAVLQTMVEQGQPVSRGQPLARIDDATLRETELSARAAVTTAQNSADVAKRQVDRNQALLKAGAIAERDMELATNQYTAAQAQLANARALLANAQKQLNKTTIVAPFTGIVSERQVSAGDVVQPGGAMFTIVNPATMRLEASVPANELAEVRLGEPVDFTVNGYPSRHFTGKITNINPVADPTTRQVRIIASIPNSGNVLVGGLFADGHVASEVRTAPVVPAAAVDERGLKPFVMQIKNGMVKKTEVELGIHDAATETVEIRSGLVPGDTILLGAARGISEKTPVKVSAPVDTARSSPQGTPRGTP